MRKFVRSEGYARARLVTGAVFMVLGAALLVRTLADVGLSWSAVPAYVLGIAMLMLGAFRFRDYFTARARP